jgi:hypothetical protein
LIECPGYQDSGQARALQRRHKSARDLAIAFDAASDYFEFAHFFQWYGGQDGSVDCDPEVARSVAFTSAGQPSNPELFVLDVFATLNSILADCGVRQSRKPC